MCLFLLPEPESKQLTTGPEKKSPASPCTLPTKHSSTIYIPTLQFLLKNSALQVHTWQLCESRNNPISPAVRADVFMRNFMTLNTHCCMFSCWCQMAEQALSQELLCSEGGQSVSYIFHLGQWQLLRGDYSKAAANLQKVLCIKSQVSTMEMWCIHIF